MVGGSPDDRLLVFAATQATGTSTHSSREVDVLIDSTGDGVIDFITFVADNGLILEGAVDGTLSAFTIDAETGKLVDLLGGGRPGQRLDGAAAGAGQLARARPQTPGRSSSPQPG